jgi:hypothetical protein
MRIDLVELFCSIHDFWINFEYQWNHMLLSEVKRAPRRLPGLHQSEVMTISLTPGNVDDRAPVPALVERGIIGLLFGDRGYISRELAETLLKHGVQLITRLRSNMKNKLMPSEVNRRCR